MSIKILVTGSDGFIGSHLAENRFGLDMMSELLLCTILDLLRLSRLKIRREK